MTENNKELRKRANTYKAITTQGQEVDILTDWGYGAEWLQHNNIIYAAARRMLADNSYNFETKPKNAAQMLYAMPYTSMSAFAAVWVVGDTVAKGSAQLRAIALGYLGGTVCPVAYLCDNRISVELFEIIK